MKKICYLLTFMFAGLLVLAQSIGAQEGDPVSVVQMVSRAQQEAAVGNLDEALRLAREAVDEDPAYVKAWKQLADIQMRREDYSGAATVLKTCSELDPEDPRVWVDLGRSLWLTDRREEAIEALSNAVRLEPDDAAAWRDLGRWLWEEEESEEAIEALSKATELDPANAAAWRDLGWFLWEQGLKRDAIVALDKAIRGGVKEKESVVLQVVAALAEESGKAPEVAVKLQKRWMPDSRYITTGLALAQKNRMLAALPFFAAAWDAGEDPVVSGVYAAYASSLNGECGMVHEYLDPLLSRELEEADPDQLDMLLKTLKACSSDESLMPVIERVDNKLSGQPEYETQIVDILEYVADRLRVTHEREGSLSFYNRVLARDPNRLCWVYAYRLTEEMQNTESARQLILALHDRADAQAVRAGIEGKLAEIKGDYEAAIASYQESLEAEPEQMEIRRYLFADEIKVGRLDEAREEAVWFWGKVTAGEDSLRPYLAEMWAMLGEDEKALDLWQALSEESPDVSYYGVERAATLYRLCRPEEALQNLNDLYERTDNPLVPELAAEIEFSLAQASNALTWATNALARKPTQGLRRYHAESAEMAGLTTTNTAPEALAALESATNFINEAPGYVPMTLLAGRTMAALNMTNEAVAFHESLRERNPQFLPSLIFLREYASRRRVFEEAIDLADEVTVQRPWDVEAHRRYAVSLAEYERFRPALKRLRKWARKEPNHATAVLVYRNVDTCSYPGKNSIQQLIEHIHRLDEEDFTFITPAQLADATNYPSVMIVLVDADREVVDAVDAVLRQVDGRAVYAGNSGLLTKERPNKPSPSELEALTAEGRWQIASAGPEDFEAAPINAEGVEGNPLTHPIVVEGVLETTNQFLARIDKSLAGFAETLGGQSPKVLVYPRGDYGQLSLDTTSNNLEAVQQILSNHFDYAVCSDDAGFIIPDFEPTRLPARVVPAGWTTDQLMEHIKRGNPLVKTRLELAKVSYWHRQHEVANKWFAKMEQEGADATEVNFNWGANAYQQGDLATALEKLRKAQTFDPLSPKIGEAVEKALDRRAPSLDLRMLSWEDNEDRSYYQWGGEAHLHLVDKMRIGALVDRNHWEHDELGEEQGTRYGGELLWYIRPGVWFDGQLWQLDMDDLEDHTGGSASLHLPNSLLSGYVDLEFSRQEIETVEALRADIYADRYAFNTYSRLFDNWNLYADFSLTDRTDDNQTQMLDGRFMRRLKEWPYLGIGYRFRFADSDFDPEEYWAPEELEQHQLYGTWRGEWRRLNYSVAGQAGYARERDTDWRFVWGARGKAGYDITTKLTLTGEFIYFEGPEYERTTWWIGLSGHL